MEALFVLVYGEGNPAYNGRVYILYTGTHYDALVGVSDGQESDTQAEVRFFPLGDEAGKAMALEVAAVEQAEAEKRAKERRRKVLKCDGCGAICEDTDAFQEHCAEVEHD